MNCCAVWLLPSSATTRQPALFARGLIGDANGRREQILDCPPLHAHPYSIKENPARGESGAFRIVIRRDFRGREWHSKRKIALRLLQRSWST